MKLDIAVRVSRYTCAIAVLLACIAAAPLRAQGIHWKPIDGPYGGTVAALALDRASNILFAATNGGGVYRSSDVGANWTQLRDGLGTYYVTALAIDSAHGVLAGTAGGGIYRSSDSGATWSQLGTGFPPSQVSDLAVLPNRTVLASSVSSGVFRLSDTATGWVGASNGFTTNTVLALTVDASGRVYAGAQGGGVFSTDDQGDNWTQLNSGLSKGPVSDVLITPGGVLLAGVNGKGVFRSIDSGVTWVKTSSGLTNTLVVALAVGQAGALLAATSGGVYRSVDGAESWQPVVGFGLTNPAVLAMLVDNGGRVWVGTDGSGAYRSLNNGETWSQLNHGLTSTDIRDVAFGPNGDIFVATNGYSTDPNSGAYRSNDNGVTWKPINTNLTNNDLRNFIFAPNGDLFAASYGGGVFRSRDNGDSWTLIAKGTEGARTSEANILARDSAGTVFVGTLGGLFKLDTVTDSWIKLNGDLVDTNVHGLAITVNGDYFVGSLRNISRSTDGGASWRRVRSFPTGSVYSIVAAPNGHLFAGTFMQGVWRSVDNGETWIEMNNGLSDSDVEVLTVNRTGDLFVGTARSGVFRSGDDGATWTQVNDGLGTPTVLAFAFDPSGRVIAGTGGSGLFTTTGSTLGVAANKDRAVEGGGMEILPNPASGSALVRYHVAAAGPARIEIFNTLGERVAASVEQPGTAPVRDAAIDVAALPAGSYVVRLACGGTVVSRVLTVVR